MTTVTTEPTPFDPLTATETDWLALNRFENVMHASYGPDEPPVQIDRTRLDYEAARPLTPRKHWLVRTGDQADILASGSVEFRSGSGNDQVATFLIDVAPDLRRQGIAARLLPLVVEAATAEKRSLLTTRTDDRVPAGQAFLKRLGANRTEDWTHSRLDLQGVDRTLMATWIARASERASDFKLVFWKGLSRTHDQARLVAKVHALAIPPLESVGSAPHEMSPKETLQWEAARADRGIERWTLAARHEASGDYAGLTALNVDPYQPEAVGQGDTGVLPEYRGLGLGRLLKAAMLEKVVRELPEARYIRTGNDATNKPMLKINEEMGFKPYKTVTLWQIDVASVLGYIGASSGV